MLWNFAATATKMNELGTNDFQINYALWLSELLQKPMPLCDASINRDLMETMLYNSNRETTMIHTLMSMQCTVGLQDVRDSVL